MPSLPVNCIVYQGGANDDLYIGTDVGVYYKNNNMTEWVPFNNGLPNVIVTELEINYNEGTISASTFGRGVWQSPLNTVSESSFLINEYSINVFPNPAENEITINTTDWKNYQVVIYSMTGEKIIESRSKKNRCFKVKFWILFS